MGKGGGGILRLYEISYNAENQKNDEFIISFQYIKTNP